MTYNQILAIAFAALGGYLFIDGSLSLIEDCTLQNYKKISIVGGVLFLLAAGDLLV